MKSTIRAGLLVLASLYSVTMFTGCLGGGSSSGASSDCPQLTGTFTVTGGSATIAGLTTFASGCADIYNNDVGAPGQNFTWGEWSTAANADSGNYIVPSAAQLQLQEHNAYPSPTGTYDGGDLCVVDANGTIWCGTPGTGSITITTSTATTLAGTFSGLDMYVEVGSGQPDVTGFSGSFSVGLGGGGGGGGGGTFSVPVTLGCAASAFDGQISVTANSGNFTCTCTAGVASGCSGTVTASTSSPILLMALSSNGEFTSWTDCSTASGAHSASDTFIGSCQLDVESGETITGIKAGFGPDATFTSVSPTSGPVGTQITLTGTNFEPGMALDFNTGAGTASQCTLTYVNSTTMKCNVPSLAAGAYTLFLITGGAGPHIVNGFTVN